MNNDTPSQTPSPKLPPLNWPDPRKQKPTTAPTSQLRLPKRFLPPSQVLERVHGTQVPFSRETVPMGVGRLW